MVCLKLDCLIDVPQFLLLASRSIWPKLDRMDLVGILDEDNSGYYRIRSKEIQAGSDLLRGFQAALPNMPKLTTLGTRFRDSERYFWAFSLCVDLSTRLDIERRVWQPEYVPSSTCTFNPIKHAVTPCCPLATESGIVVAHDGTLPGHLVTELQNTVWQFRRLDLAVFCCRENEMGEFLDTPLPCSQWNKETKSWDPAFMNNMDVYIYDMGLHWERMDFDRFGWYWERVYQEWFGWD